MIDPSELRQLAIDFARLESAGLLGELEQDLSTFPKDESHLADPFHSVGVAKIGRAMSRMTGEPECRCMLASKEALNPSRRKYFFELVAWYVAQLDERDTTDTNAAKLARARRRGV